MSRFDSLSGSGARIEGSASRTQACRKKVGKLASQIIP